MRCQAAAHVALGQVFAAVLTCQAGLRVEPGFSFTKIVWFCSLGWQ